MTRQRWTVLASAAAALGGLAWVAKVAVIIATDGRIVDEGPAALFYILGAVLMLAGSTAIGARLTEERSGRIAGLAMAFSPVLFILSFIVLDGLAKPLVGDRGPAYWRDEAGILVTGLAWLGAGIGLRLSAERSGDDRLERREPQSSSPGSLTTP